MQIEVGDDGIAYMKINGVLVAIPTVNQLKTLNRNMVEVQLGLASLIKRLEKLEAGQTA